MSSDVQFIRWPKEEIEAILAEALISGAIRLQLESAADAKHFRFALYNYRRQADNLELRSLSFSVEGNEVLISRIKTPELKRIG